MKSIDPSLGQSRDQVGIVVAALCAMHCIGLPLLSVIPAASWLAQEGWDWFFVTASVAIGCGSLVPAYWSIHRRKRCLALLFAGLLSVAMGKLAAEGVPDTPLMVVGAAFLILAHMTNQHFCRQCRNCSVKTASI